MVNIVMTVLDKQAYKEESALFAFFHDLFRYPTQEQWEWLNRSEVQDVIDFLINKYFIPEGINFYRDPDSVKEYEESFITLFEAGLPHPPCPLIESHWNKNDPIPKILHENILFYKTFGLELKEEAKETADHLRFQLEFYCHLTKLLADEAHEDEMNDHTSQILHAKNDYLHRHLLSWIPIAVQKLQDTAPDSHFTLWMKLLECYVRDQSVNGNKAHGKQQ